MKNKTVLFVDDEISILNTLKRLLRNEEYQLLTASSAEEGLELLDSKKVDIVISDMRMPNIDGAEFLEKVKSKHPDIGRMIMSGFADLESVVKAINKGDINQFISKPWDNDTLKQVVKDHLPQSTADNNHARQDSEEVLQLKQLVHEQQQKIIQLNEQLHELTHRA
ncbi:MAG: response regulator [Bermanella sp.]